MLSVPAGFTVELRRFTVTKGRGHTAGGIVNYGTLTLTGSTVSENTANPDDAFQGAGGIVNSGILALTNSTVSENTSDGILNGGTVTLSDSTVSGNTGFGIVTVGETLTMTNSTLSGNTSDGIFNYGGTVALTNCTVSGNGSSGLSNRDDGTVTLVNTLVDDTCFGLDEAVFVSGGHNIESPGNTCGFDTNKGDQIDVTAEQLNLGPLQHNGGPTMTHALLTEPAPSVAIDVIPEEECGVDVDQRRVSRPRGDACNVGAVEMDLACLGVDNLAECVEGNFTGFCVADICWAIDCSDLEDGITCLYPGEVDVGPGLCVAGSCEPGWPLPL